MLCKAIGAVPVPRTDDWLVPAFYESGNHPENGQGTFMCSSKQMGSCLGEATYTTSSRSRPPRPSRSRAITAPADYYSDAGKAACKACGDGFVLPVADADSGTRDHTRCDPCDAGQFETPVALNAALEDASVAGDDAVGRETFEHHADDPAAAFR